MFRFFKFILGKTWANNVKAEKVKFALRSANLDLERFPENDEVWWKRNAIQDLLYFYNENPVSERMLEDAITNIISKPFGDLTKQDFVVLKVLHSWLRKGAI